jgi:hypothetical protein
MTGGAVSVPLFGRPHRILPLAVLDPEGRPAPPAVAELLRDFLARQGDGVPLRWVKVSFRDFAGSGPLTMRFADHTHSLIARAFAGRLADLARACGRLNGEIHPDPREADFEVRFEALPGVPLFLGFNDREGDLPAQCRLLFDASVEQALSLRSRGTLGTYLTGALLGGGRAAGSPAGPEGPEPPAGQSP